MRAPSREERSPGVHCSDAQASRLRCTAPCGRRASQPSASRTSDQRSPGAEGSEHWSYQGTFRTTNITAISATPHAASLSRLRRGGRADGSPPEPLCVPPITSTNLGRRIPIVESPKARGWGSHFDEVFGPLDERNEGTRKVGCCPRRGSSTGGEETLAVRCGVPGAPHHLR